MDAKSKVVIETSPTKPNPSSTVPFSRDPDFIDSTILAKIDEIFSKAASRVALVGLGGVGSVLGLLTQVDHVLIRQQGNRSLPSSTRIGLESVLPKRGSFGSMQAMQPGSKKGTR